MEHRIRAITGPNAGSTFPLARCSTIGRGTNMDVQVIGKGVSRGHAFIILDDRDNMVLVDMSSKNGTYVNDEPIKRHTLAQGEAFRIGDVEFVYERDVSLRELAVEVQLLSGPALAVTSADDDKVPVEATGVEAVAELLERTS